MRAVGEDGAEEALGVAGRDWAVGDPARRGLHLDHRLEPIEAARAGAYDVDRDFLSRRRGAEGRCDFFGPDRQRAGIGGYEQPQRHRCASASKVSSRP